MNTLELRIGLMHKQDLPCCCNLNNCDCLDIADYLSEMLAGACDACADVVNSYDVTHTDAHMALEALDMKPCACMIVQTTLDTLKTLNVLSNTLE